MNCLCISVRHAQLLQKVFKLKAIQRCHYAVPSSLPFKIPEPIERLPTELLEALSKTVGVDVTAPHFGFIDDPATIPTSIAKKKHYFLCKVIKQQFLLKLN